MLLCGVYFKRGDVSGWWWVFISLNLFLRVSVGFNKKMGWRKVLGYFSEIFLFLELILVYFFYGMEMVGGGFLRVDYNRLGRT